MARSEAALAAPKTIGALLQYWRKARHLSQLALALEAEVSPRHLCFLETGRARPSREMVARLASVLDVPLRERNALLLAAGFAPLYGEAQLGAAQMKPVRQALEAILRQQEPYPAVVMNRQWDLIKSNAAADTFFAMMLGGRRPKGRPNVLRLMFDPGGVRPQLANWEEVARALVLRVQREAVGGVRDAGTEALLAEILSQPGVPAVLRRPNLEAPVSPILPIHFVRGEQRFHYFSTVTTLGTAQDVTLQELRIECFHPADRATELAARALSARPGGVQRRKERSSPSFSA